MKNNIIVALVIIVAFLKTTYAQDEPKHAISICAIAIPALNMYVLNYEYLFSKHQGLAARIEYAPNLKGANTKGDGWGGVLNYRFYFSPKMENLFVGTYVRFRYVNGSGTSGTTDYDFDVYEFNSGINGGYRWVTKFGFNIVVAAGYGYSIGKENLTPSNTDVISTFSAFKNDNNTTKSMLDSPFYGEVSFGFAF